MKTEIAILKELLRQAKASHGIRNFTLSVDTDTLQRGSSDGRVLNERTGIRRVDLSFELVGTRSETISGNEAWNGLGADTVSAESGSVASGNKPQWKDAPQWAMWLAQDADGEWCWCEKKPSAVVWYWYPDGHFSSACESKPNPDWRNTPEARP